MSNFLEQCEVLDSRGIVYEASCLEEVKFLYDNVDNKALLDSCQCLGKLKNDFIIRENLKIDSYKPLTPFFELYEIEYVDDELDLKTNQGSVKSSVRLNSSKADEATSRKLFCLMSDFKEWEMSNREVPQAIFMRHKKQIRDVEDYLFLVLDYRPHSIDEKEQFKDLFVGTQQDNEFIAELYQQSLTHRLRMIELRKNSMNERELDYLLKDIEKIVELNDDTLDI